MAIIKSYSDLQQSKILSKILPLESADMSWVSNGLGKPFTRTIPIKGNPEELCGCWSLTALLNYLKSKNKFPDIKELSDGRFKLTTFIWDGKNSFQVSIADNLVDACYKLVLKLHECEML